MTLGAWQKVGLKNFPVATWHTCSEILWNKCLGCQHLWALSLSQEGLAKHKDLKQGGAFPVPGPLPVSSEGPPTPTAVPVVQDGPPGLGRQTLLFTSSHSPRCRMSQTQMSWLLAQLEDAPGES